MPTTATSPSVALQGALLREHGFRHSSRERIDVRFHGTWQRVVRGPFIVVTETGEVWRAESGPGNEVSQGLAVSITTFGQIVKQLCPKGPTTSLASSLS